MLRKYAVILFALVLTGCAGGIINPITNQPITAADLQALASSVQSAAVQSCNFLPTITTVTNIVLANNSSAAAAGQSAEAVAKLICDAVLASPPKAGKLRASLPTVNGVVVHGQFVKRGAHLGAIPSVNGVGIQGWFVK